MSLGTWIKRSWTRLYVKMIKEKASPEYIARGWAIGMFYGCTIPFGFQLALSIPTSFILKGSKVGATLGTLLTNHVTIFFIYPAQCYVGNLLMGGNLTFAKAQEAMVDVLKHQDYSTLFGLGGELVCSFFIGGFLLAAVTTPTTYFGVLNAVKRYREAKAKRAEKIKNKKVK